MISRMRQLIKFVKKEDGLGTVEIVLIIAVLVALAFIFRTEIIGFLNNILQEIVGVADEFDPGNVQ